MWRYELRGENNVVVDAGSGYRTQHEAKSAGEWARGWFEELRRYPAKSLVLVIVALREELMSGSEEKVIQRLKDHVAQNKARREQSTSP